MSCCDVYGNAHGDWVGCIAAQYGIDGNISANPQFCDMESGDFHLWNYSPCSQYTCGLIGALPVNCWDVQDTHSGGFDRSDLRLEVGPNPSFGAVTLGFKLPAEKAGTIEIFDTGGRLVWGFPAASSGGVAIWNEMDLQGRAVPAGIYYARLTAATRSITRAVVVIR